MFFLNRVFLFTFKTSLKNQTYILCGVFCIIGQLLLLAVELEKHFKEEKKKDFPSYLCWSVVYKKKATDKKGTNGKKNEVKGESNQEKEEQIMVKKKELKDQEKEKEVEKEKEENVTQCKITFEFSTKIQTMH